jgi:hypothetical protein
MHCARDNVNARLYVDSRWGQVVPLCCFVDACLYLCWHVRNVLARVAVAVLGSRVNKCCTQLCGYLCHAAVVNAFTMLHS